MLISAMYIHVYIPNSQIKTESLEETEAIYTFLPCIYITEISITIYISQPSYARNMSILMFMCIYNLYLNYKFNKL